MTINNSQFIARNGLDNGSNTIINVAEPINNNDVATKHYVDTNVIWQNISKDPIVYMSKGIYNGFVLVTGSATIGYKLYTTHGSTTGYNFHATGRGADADDPFVGVNNNLKEIYIPTNANISKVSTDGATVHVLMDNHELWGWGWNGNGQLGLGTTTAVVFPTLLRTDVVDIYPVSYSPCDNPGVNSRMFIKLTSNGTTVPGTVGADALYCAGYNGNGQLGKGSTTNQTSWAPVTTGPFNANGNLTSGGTIVNVWNLGLMYGNTFVEVNITGTGHKLYGCGNNLNGSLGNGNTTQQNSLIDVTNAWFGAVTSANNIVNKVVFGVYENTGTASTAASTGMWLNSTTNQIKFAGDNSVGILCTGNVTDSSTPVSISPTTFNNVTLSDLCLIGGRSKTAIILTAANKMYTWGYNAYGQCGNGTTTNVGSTTGVTTPYSNTTTHQGVAQIMSDGTANSGTNTYKTQLIYKKTDNTLWACGYDDAIGYTGTGSSAAVTTPKQVRLPPSVIPTTLGYFGPAQGYHVWVLGSDKGYIYTWGYNGTYAITDESTYSVMTPVQVNLPPYSD